MCRRKAILHVLVARDDFRLEQGNEALSTYSFNTHTAKHHFCSVCGIHGFYVPRSNPDGFSVNARCLDDVDAIARFSIQPFGGDNWEDNVDTLPDREGS